MNESENITTMKESLDRLLAAKKFKVLDVKNSPSQHNVKGVYLISTNEKIIYVGKTRTGTIGTRLRDHVNIKERSDLNQMIKQHENYPQEIKEYDVQHIEVSEDRERGRVENFIISILNPPFNKIEY
jgi:hypothetical protein